MRRIKEQQHGGEIDFWETPPDAVAPILPYIWPPKNAGQGITIVDPGAGTGAVSMAAILQGYPANRVIAIENNDKLADECEARFDTVFGKAVEWSVIRRDWLGVQALGIKLEGGVVVLGNPPYTKPYRQIGVDFAVCALEFAYTYGGGVALLLPLDFATGKARTERVHSQYTTSVHPLRKRPHFGGPHSTGKRPFSWFTWDTWRNLPPTFKVIG
jgi:predicted RNA methylase